jgi:hypothetical protein
MDIGNSANAFAIPAKSLSEHAVLAGRPLNGFQIGVIKQSWKAELMTKHNAIWPYLNPCSARRIVTWD